MRKYIHQEILKSIEIFKSMSDDADLMEILEAAAKECVTRLKNEGKIFLIGNGGSAADAQHIAGELVSRFAFDRAGLAAIALTTDTSILTAIGNDYGYENLFSRQIQALARSGDVVIAYSTSGNSENTIQGLKQAKKMKICTVGFTGQGRGQMSGYCDFLIEIPSSETPKIQEGHALLGHILCGLIENKLFSGI